MENVDKLNEIKKIANNVIYFNDNSDYLGTLWEILIISDDTKEEDGLYTEHELSFIE